LVHLDTGEKPPVAGAPDPEATGSRPPPDAGDPAPVADRPRLPWRRIVVFATVAVLLGTVLGIAGQWLRSPGGNHQLTNASPTGPESGHPVGTFTGSLPAGTGPPQADVGDPRLAPVITGAQDQGTSIVLTWRDPSGGQATFIVVQVVGSGARAIRTLSPGTTHTTVDGLDPTAARYCFALVALVGQDRAASATRCVTRTR
jgi:hypothetical protein